MNKLHLSLVSGLLLLALGGKAHAQVTIDFGATDVTATIQNITGGVSVTLVNPTPLSSSGVGGGFFSLPALYLNVGPSGLNLAGLTVTQQTGGSNPTGTEDGVVKSSSVGSFETGNGEYLGLFTLLIQFQTGSPGAFTSTFNITDTASNLTVNSFLYGSGADPGHGATGGVLAAVENDGGGPPPDYAGTLAGSVQPQISTPEPASITMLGFGIAGLAGYGWRKRKPVVATKTVA